MGGTTAKTSLVHGREPSVAEGYYIGGYADGHPAMMPVVDIVEVGTGGGSIAWIDEVGALKVGPHSAGADPGPICYRRGGTKPTVTDANVILGRIGTDSFLGGEMQLDRDAALAAAEELGRPLGMNAVASALSIVEIAVAKMSLAVRGVSVERGFDPRDFVMVGMGGAGPIHSVAIARQLHIPTVIIPVLPSHFSAFGMLMSDIRHDYVRTQLVALPKLNFGELQKIFADMIDDGTRMLAGERVSDDAMIFQRFLDLRYEGQEFSIKVPVSAEEIAAGDLQTIRTGSIPSTIAVSATPRPNEPLEMVNIRLSARGIRQKLKMPAVASGGGAPKPRTHPQGLPRERGSVRGLPGLCARHAGCGRGDRRSGADRGIRLDDRHVCRRSRQDIGDRGNHHHVGGRAVNVVSRDLRKRLDPVTLEVIRNAMPAISNEMSYDLQRTSYNMMIYEVCDYSCTLLDTAGTLMSQNIGGVSHFIADMGVVIKDGIDALWLGEFCTKGDVLITNHQAVAGQHLNNIVIYTPFFLDGVLTAFPGRAGALGRCRRLVDRFRRARLDRSVVRRVCSSISSRSTRPASRTTSCCR